MSDDEPKDATLEPHDDELLRLLDEPDASDGSAERTALETLGLLPHALEELRPAPDVKRRLMASVAGSERDASSEALTATSGRLVVLERRARWFVQLAAVLALVLIGIAALQFRQLESQQETIERLSAQLGRVEQKGAELAAIREALAEKGSQLRMATTRGAEFCVLKPFGDSPRYPAATATMVISPDRDVWYLAVEGLEPCAAECYQLWFLTEGETVWAASFDAPGADQRIELSGAQDGVPAGVRAISITREPETGTMEPRETILLADQAMTLL